MHQSRIYNIANMPLNVIREKKLSRQFLNLQFLYRMGQTRYYIIIKLINF